MMDAYATNTLRYEPSRCNGCGMCSVVCPHGVFSQANGVADLVRPGDCMECGACQRNCPAGAIEVDSGVGCAQALIYAALTGREPSCCGPGDEACTGSDGAGREAGEAACCGDSGETDEPSEGRSCCG